MDDYFKLIERRESCRAYDARPVEKEKLLRCVEAARLAPSACNSQPWRYLVVTNPETLNSLRPCVQEMGMNKFASGSPALVVVLEEHAALLERAAARFRSQNFAQIDIGLSVSQFCYAATEQGLSTCILGMLNENRIRTLFELPKDTRIRLVLCVGYAADDKLREKKRKPLEEIARFYE